MTKFGPAVLSVLFAVTTLAAPPSLSSAKLTPNQEKAVLGALSWHFEKSDPEKNGGSAPNATLYVARGQGDRKSVV